MGGSKIPLPGKGFVMTFAQVATSDPIDGADRGSLSGSKEEAQLAVLARSADIFIVKCHVSEACRGGQQNTCAEGTVLQGPRSSFAMS